MTKNPANKNTFLNILHLTHAIKDLSKQQLPGFKSSNIDDASRGEISNFFILFYFILFYEEILHTKKSIKSK